MNDSDTTVQKLRDVVARFVSERRWEKFHSPKNLSMALAIEAAELMEHFQWISTDASRAVADDARKRVAVAEELADVLCYTLALANEMNLDLAQALRDKMVKNERKYPADQYQGRYGPEDDGEADP